MKLEYGGVDFGFGGCQVVPRDAVMDPKPVEASEDDDDEDDEDDDEDDEDAPKVKKLKQSPLAGILCGLIPSLEKQYKP